MAASRPVLDRWTVDSAALCVISAHSTPPHLLTPTWSTAPILGRVLPPATLSRVPSFQSYPHFNFILPSLRSQLDMSALFVLVLAALLAIANAADSPAFTLPLFTPPITPANPSTFVHPLLATINYRTATHPTDIQPGQLNYYNFTRPEGTREFYLYVPTTYTEKMAYPFTFYFHGYSANWMQGVSLNMTTDAEAAGYLIAFPQGTPSSSNLLGWNGGVCCLFNTSTIVDDVEFTRVALKMIQSAANVDSSRVYTSGWSNGGYMSERLACEAGELFAGVCADASAVGILPGGLAGLASCDRSFGKKRINYLHFHGTADSAVPWTGSFTSNGTNVTPSTLRDISRWTRRLDCSAMSEQTYNDGTFSNLVWPECRDHRIVELMTVRNGVHAWWTKDQGNFETMAYVLEFFTRTWKRDNSTAEVEMASE